MNSFRRGFMAAALVGALTVIFGCGSGAQQTNFDAKITGPDDAGDITILPPPTPVWDGVRYREWFLVTNPDGSPVPNAEVILNPSSVSGGSCITPSGVTTIDAVLLGFLGYPGFWTDCPDPLTLAADNEGKVKVDFFLLTPPCDNACKGADITTTGGVIGEVGANFAEWKAKIIVKACPDPSCLITPTPTPSPTPTPTP